MPACASSRKRVVRPMLRKQKMKAQVRRSLIGATSAGFTDLVVIGEAVAAGRPGDEQRGDEEADHEFREAPPDLGRHSALRPVSRCSQRVVATIASTKAQMPIHTSRPDHLHQREGEDRLVAACRRRAVAGEAAIGLRRGDTRPRRRIPRCRSRRRRRRPADAAPRDRAAGRRSSRSPRGSPA